MLALLLILADVTTHYETVKVADGIYAFIAPESNSPIVNGNVTVITGDDGVVGSTPDNSRRSRSGRSRRSAS